MILSRIFTKQSIFIIFIICLFIFILNNNIIETKLKQKYNNSNNNNIYNNNNNKNNKNNNKNNNNKIKLQYSKLNNLNFINEEFPQLYTYNTERDEKLITIIDDEEYDDHHHHHDDNSNDNKLFNNEIKEEWSKLPTDMMIEKKRICIVTTEIEGPVLGGGIGTAYTALSQKLNEDGHTITIVLINKVKKLSASHWIELYKQAGIELIVLDFLLLDPMTVDGGVKTAIENQNAIDPLDMDNIIGIIGCTGPCIRSYRTYLWLSRHESQFDVIHFHDNGGMAYFSTLAQHQGLHFQSINIVIGGHGPHLWERTANSANLDDGKHFEVDYLEKKSVEFSNWLISPSNYMLNWMKYNRWQLPLHSYVHQNLLPGKNQQPQPSFDNVLFKQQGDDSSSSADNNQLEKQQIKHDFNELLFFGRLESRKGLDTFLIALESLSDLIKNKKMHITFLGSNTKLVELNMMADSYIELVCKRLDIPCLVLIGKSHTEAIQYLTTDKDSKLVVVASPIDNSPNTVLEGLTHRLAIIATNVGGIPELIHPQDRDRVLFDPKPKSLVKLIRKLKAEGVSPARFSTDEWSRQIIWSNWHSVVQISPLIQSKNKKISQLKLMNQKKLLTIVLVYDRDNTETLIKNIKSIGVQSKTTPFYVVEIIIAKSSKIPGGSNGRISLEVTKLLNEYSLTYNVTVIHQYLLQPFQVWNSKEIIHQSKGEFVLFLDPLDYLSNNALEILGQVESYTDSSIITGSVLFSNNSLVINQIYQQLNTNSQQTNTVMDTTTSVSSIFLGCSGMPGMMYNCYGSNNMMVRKSALLDLASQYSFDEISDYNSDIENSGAWDFYAQSTNNGYSLQTIPKNIFISDRVEYEPPNTYSQELRVLKNFDNILPTSFELAPLATRHFLTSKKFYVNEIINANAKSKECDRLLSLGGAGGQQQAQQQQPEMFNDDGEENKQYMETRNHIKMVFIRGHEKSGTSWLKKVVDLHPRIFMAKQEFHFAMLEEGLDKFTSIPWAAAQEPYRSYTKKWYKSFVRNLLLSGVSPSLAPLINWVGEKTPSPLAPIISGSRYILIVRDGRDVVVSLFWHYVRLGGFENWCGPNEKHLVNPEYVKEYRAINGSKDYFDRYPERLLENEVCFRKIVGSWYKRVQEDQAAIDTLESNPSVAKVFSLRYEELHRNPEEYRKSIYEFLDLDHREAEALSVDDKTLPGGFNEKSDKNKFFRKGEIGDWKNYFTKENKIWFKQETGNLLVDLGYELNNDW